MAVVTRGPVSLAQLMDATVRRITPSNDYFGRPIQKRGMQVQHTRVDFLPAEGSDCAICVFVAHVRRKGKRVDFPHLFRGERHDW